MSDARDQMRVAIGQFSVMTDDILRFGAQLGITVTGLLVGYVALGVVLALRPELTGTRDC